jgi:RimJ/RimL family protein N-acetyltransferase
VGLQVETVERVRAFWRAWEAQTDMPDRVSVVVIGPDRFTCAPEQVRGRIDTEAPTELSALIEVLGNDVEHVVGQARLAYTDEATFRAVGTDGVTSVGDDDARLAVLRAASDRGEWSEASADEPCELRYAVVDDDSLLAVATLQIWNDTLGHVGVFSAAHARRHGLASRVGSAVVSYAFTRSLVPQWRSRVGNDASARVGDRLGFVDLGTQMTVRVKLRNAGN